MKLRISQISIILLTLVMFGCFDAPELSDIPLIEFKRIEFFEVPDNCDPVVSQCPIDSLVLTFSIEDGDGDIGLYGEEYFPPFHPYNKIIDAEGKLVRLVGDVGDGSNDYKLPFYKINAFQNVSDKVLFSEEDNRPTSFDCKNFVVGADAGTSNPDSAIFIEQNPYNKNLVIDILKKKNGVYESVDYASYTNFTSCEESSFSSRIPVFDDENLGRTLKGEISYSMPSSGHIYVLNRDTFKIRFYIYDRHLNQSNVVETPDVTLSQISAN